MGNKQQKTIYRVIANASDLFISLSDPAKTVDVNLGEEVLRHIGSDAIRYQDERWIITELGFVTMAIVPRYCTRIDDALVVPGVDDRNNRGHLVLRFGAVPYHSLSGDPQRAYREAVGAAQRAARLVNYFGSRDALRQAARSAPWHLRSTASDVRRAGLCTWGVDSWLSRIGVGRLAYRTGLPRLFVRMAGGYGDRITAMTIMRLEQARKTVDIPTGLPARVPNVTKASQLQAPHQHQAGRPAIAEQTPSVSNQSMLPTFIRP
jgi:hypothetical protein